MKHLGVCLQRLPREKHFYRQQASSAGRGGARTAPLSRPSARLLAAHLPFWSCTILPRRGPGPARPASPGVGVADPSGLLSSHASAFRAGS